MTPANTMRLDAARPKPSEARRRPSCTMAQTWYRNSLEQHRQPTFFPPGSMRYFRELILPVHAAFLRMRLAVHSLWLTQRELFKRNTLLSPSATPRWAALPQQIALVTPARELDATNLYFYRARYYNPVLARFVSQDPIGFAGGINLYAYVSNDPIDSVDPFGLHARGPTPGGGRGAGEGSGNSSGGSNNAQQNQNPPFTHPSGQQCATIQQDMGNWELAFAGTWGAWISVSRNGQPWAVAAAPYVLATSVAISVGAVTEGAYFRLFLSVVPRGLHLDEVRNTQQCVIAVTNVRRGGDGSSAQETRSTV